MALTTTVSVSYKKQPRQYESIDVFMSVNGIDANTTQEEIDEQLDGPAKLAYAAIVTRLSGRVRAAAAHMKENT